MSKVLVGSLLEHKIAKRANFVGLKIQETSYFSQYGFTLIALLTDVLFEAYAQQIIEDQPLNSEIDLRKQLFINILPPEIEIQRKFSYTQVRYNEGDQKSHYEW